MATALTVVDLPGAYESDPLITPVDPGFVAADLTGNTFRSTGREVLLVRNDDAAPQTITIASNPASRTGRNGPITAASLGIGASGAFQIFPSDGWAVGGLITVTASDVDLMLAVVRLPAQSAG